MIEFPGRGILLDVEGTTSSVRYVYDVLFACVRRELDAYLGSCWDFPDVSHARDLIAHDAGALSFADWTPGLDRAAAQEKTRAEILRLMDGDVKATGLKELQGLIWRRGFENGTLRAHVFPDVAPALQAWSARGLDVRIFSSGSVTAQKLFFAHTEHGDLLPYLRGHYDTTIGPKREARSYAAIAREMALPPSEILFLSDIVAELDAARAAGMATGLTLREGNAAVAPGHGHAELASFAEIETKRPASK